MSTLQRRLDTGEVILIDGGTGTELERIGVPMVEGAWCGDAVRTHPDEHVQVHRSHIEAGADLVITNTYASSRHLLAMAGLDQHFELINRRAVELALRARDESGRGEVAVAGSISTTMQGEPLPPLDVVRPNFVDQARILADAGAELIVLEMMRDIDQTLVCIEAAEATGLPIWLGWSARAVTEGLPEPLLWDRGHTLREAVAAVADAPIDVTLIMHTEVADVDPCLDVLAETETRPLGVYAHSGDFVHPHWVFNDVISADDYCAAALGWLERGVQVIGGCCGITCDHIAVLNHALAPTT